jgi:hypothetical protein
MSDRGSRDRQVMTLLVQLFGRDVMDRLAGAGFDAPAAMAKAGAERLAAEAGIPVAIARRVSIVVEESPGPATAARKEPAAQPPAPKTESASRTEPAARTEPAPQAKSAARPEPPARSNPVEQDESDMLMEASTPPEPTVREERRPARPSPRKRIEPRVAVEPIKPAAPAVPPPAEPASPAAFATSAPSAPPAPSAAAAVAASPAATAPSSASALRDTFPDEGDPFVDDVALVSWMGLSSHQPDGRLAFTVSDTILDPVDAGASASAGSPAPAGASGPSSPAGPGASGAAGRDAARLSDPGRPKAAAAAPIETPARPAMISGSFWTFGRPADSTQPSTGRKPETQPPAASPRRRKHDGH